MKVLSVIGITKSGKTTTVEAIIEALIRRGYRVGSVKEIHNEAFRIDPSPTSNTHRHRKAGAQLVCARGLFETDFLFPSKLSMEKILSLYEGDYDYVVLEGVEDIPVPTIVTAHAEDDLREKWREFAFCVSGRISAEIDGYMGMPAIDATREIEQLCDLIELKVFDRLPNVDVECCGACGGDCAQLALAILRGDKRRSDCCAEKGVHLVIDGKAIPIVPFVQRVLKGATLGIVRELDGYKEGADVEIKL